MPDETTRITDHDCMDWRERVVFEGDDLVVERCSVCGRVRLEQYSDRPMAWRYTPNASWRWQYAYADPQNSPDDPVNRWTAGPDDRAFHVFTDGYHNDQTNTWGPYR